MQHWRMLVLVTLLLGMFTSVMALDPIVQSAAYHNFADQRFLLGVPNVFDVTSNIAFVIVGTIGIGLCAGRHCPLRVTSWMVFFVATILTGVGSAYYHWSPSDATLVWDRLPLALAVMALFVALMVEHVDEAPERLVLFPALAVGAASVLWWWWRGDLRPFVWAQFAPLLCILFVILSFPARYTHRRFILYGLGLYGLAKLAEMKDLEIFVWTANIVSGHTLKHLLAAGAIFVLLAMLRRRVNIHEGEAGLAGSTPGEKAS